MSTESHSSSPALGSRENHFCSTANEYDPDRSPGDPTECTDGSETSETDDLPTPSGVNKDRWVAHQILREADGTYLCPECWHELEIVSELSEPEDHVEPSSYELDTDDSTDDTFTITLYGDHRRYRHCTNPECGVLGGGMLADRPEEAFLTVVEAVLDGINAPAAYLDDLLAAARRRKQGGVSDETNMELVLRDLRTGTDD